MAALTFHRSGDLFVVQASGPYGIEDGRAIFAHLLGAVPPGTSVRVLIDLRATRRQISYPDLYRLLEEVRTVEAALSARVASLNRWQNQFEGSQFFEASGQHAGLQFRAFTDPDAAVRWLYPDAEAAGREAARALVERLSSNGSEGAG